MVLESQLNLILLQQRSGFGDEETSKKINKMTKILESKKKLLRRKKYKARKQIKYRKDMKQKLKKVIAAVPDLANELGVIFNNLVNFVSLH